MLLNHLQDWTQYIFREVDWRVRSVQINLSVVKTGLSCVISRPFFRNIKNMSELFQLSFHNRGNHIDPIIDKKCEETPIIHSKSLLELDKSFHNAQLW